MNKPYFLIDYCSSCGLEIVSVMKNNKDYFIEKDKDEELYYICTKCKTYWDDKENKSEE